MRRLALADMMGKGAAAGCLLPHRDLDTQLVQHADGAGIDRRVECALCAARQQDYPPCRARPQLEIHGLAANPVKRGHTRRQFCQRGAHRRRQQRRKQLADTAKLHHHPEPSGIGDHTRKQPAHHPVAGRTADNLVHTLAADLDQVMIVNP